MPLVECRRCSGTGRFSDQNPGQAGRFNWCAGCRGDGRVSVPDPDVECARCRGSGHGSDANPTKPASFNWCSACNGSGYAS